MGIKKIQEALANRIKKAIPIYIHEGIRDEWLENIGDTNFVLTPSEPVDPRDCDRWPGSPYCGGLGFSFGSLIASIQKLSISSSKCEILLSMEWGAFGVRQPTITLGYRFPDCDEDDEKPMPPKDPVPLPDPINLNNYIFKPGCLYAIYFSGFSRDRNTILYAYGPIYEDRVDYRFDDGRILSCRRIFCGGFPKLKFNNLPNDIDYYAPAALSFGWEGGFYNIKLDKINHALFFDPNLTLLPFRPTERLIEFGPNGSWDAGTPTGRARGHICLYGFPYGFKSIFNEKECEPKNRPSLSKSWPLVEMKNMECCLEIRELALLNAFRLKVIWEVLQPERFLKIKDDGEIEEEPVGKAPNSMIFPKATGNFKIGGYDDLATFLIKYLDRVFGTMPISANIADADPNTPGDQNAVLQFQTISEALGAIVEANGAEISLLYKLGNLIHANQKNLEILEKIAVSGLLETGICHQLAVVIQKNTESIQDYLDYKIRQEIVNVPFAFSPTIDPPVEGWTEKQYERWVQDFLKPSDVSVKVTELDYQANSKMLSDKLAEIAANAQAAAASSKRPVSSADDLKKLIEEEKTKLDIDAAYMVQLIRKAIGLPASIDLDGFGAGLAENFEDNANLDTGLIAEYPDKKHQIKRATKDGKKVN